MRTAVGRSSVRCNIMACTQPIPLGVLSRLLLEKGCPGQPAKHGLRWHRLGVWDTGTGSRVTTCNAIDIILIPCHS